MICIIFLLVVLFAISIETERYLVAGVEPVFIFDVVAAVLLLGLLRGGDYVNMPQHF